MRVLRQIAIVWLLLGVLAGASAQAATGKHRARRAGVTKHRVGRRGAMGRTRTRAAVLRSHGRGSRGRHSARRLFNPWTEPTFADSTTGDVIEGEDLGVRKAAIDALGPYNGTIVVADPQTGRILSIVNQKLALKGAFQPCSTIKVVISLASLREGLVAADTPLRLSRRYSMDMTSALARSNNVYFARLGEQLGFERVVRYAQMFGLGEKAGLNIPGEEPGTLAAQVPGSGLGMMTSFGDGIRLTPLELTSIVSAIANGGTMYYLQYPRNESEIALFQPKVKRQLEIGSLLPQIRPGLSGAVEFGTARRASFANSDPIMGKTGTCTDTAQPGVHLGWFGSYNEAARNRLVVVVLLTGGHGVSGPVASGVAGNVYRNLAAQNYFGPVQQQSAVPTKLVSMQSCCTN